MKLNLPRLLIPVILGLELLAFAVLWAVGALSSLGPGLVAAVMCANGLIVALAVWVILRGRRS